MTIDLQDGGRQKICVIGGSRAKRLGFSFSRTTDWLPGAVAEARAASAVPTI